MNIEKSQFFISGGGSKEDSYLLDQKFIQAVGNGGKILYIPIAIESLTFKECYKWISNIFSSLDIEILEEIKQSKTNYLLKYKAIYIGGGNVFKLMGIMNKTGFTNLLIDYISKGGIIYGGSAGALIFGSNLSLGSSKNKSKPKDTYGLNLWDGISFMCHFNGSLRQKNKILKNRKEKIFALTEKTGIYFYNNQFQVVGYEPLYVFFKNKKQIIQPCSKIELKK